MRKLFFILAIGVGGWYWSNGQLPFFSTAGAYDDSGNPVVWLFTIKDCGKACSMGRNNLKSRRVTYEEKLIDPNDSSDPNVALWKSLGRGGFPLIVGGDIKIKGSGTRSMIVEMLGTNFGDRYLTRSERRFYSKHFYDDGTPRIVMYGADWCPHCKKLRTELNANNVDFLEIDVDKSAYKTQITSTMEIPGYPAVWVGYKRVNGSDLRAIEKVMRSF